MNYGHLSTTSLFFKILRALPIAIAPKDLANGSQVPLPTGVSTCQLARAIYVYYFPVCLKRSLSKSFWAMGGHDYDDSISAVCERCDSNSGDRDTGARALATILCNVRSPICVQM